MLGSKSDGQSSSTARTASFDGLIIQWLLAPEQVPSGELIAETLKRATALAAVSAESIDAV